VPLCRRISGQRQNTGPLNRIAATRGVMWQAAPSLSEAQRNQALAGLPRAADRHHLLTHSSMAALTLRARGTSTGVSVCVPPISYMCFQ
jgi:hypothetical protein